MCAQALFLSLGAIFYQRVLFFVCFGFLRCAAALSRGQCFVLSQVRYCYSVRCWFTRVQLQCVEFCGCCHPAVFEKCSVLSRLLCHTSRSSVSRARYYPRMMTIRPDVFVNFGSCCSLLGYFSAEGIHCMHPTIFHKCHTYFFDCPRLNHWSIKYFLRANY